MKTKIVDCMMEVIQQICGRKVIDSDRCTNRGVQIYTPCCMLKFMYEENSQH